MHPGIQRQGPWLEGWIAGHDVAESSRASELDGGTSFGQKTRKATFRAQLWSITQLD
jgi:hypothetical protein